MKKISISKEELRELPAVGYITAKEAHRYGVRVGDYYACYHGVCRVTKIPVDEEDGLACCWLESVADFGFADPVWVDSLSAETIVKRRAA